METFKERVLAIVKLIPAGATLTYREVAKRAGNERAARAVGVVLRTNYDPLIPCHRVIRSDGTLGGYNRGIENKQKMLAQEKHENRVMDSPITKQMNVRQISENQTLQKAFEHSMNKYGPALKKLADS